MNYLEIFAIIAKPWVSTDDIMKIANCGKNTATKIRNEVEEEIALQGKKVPPSSPILVPTNMVLDYLGLDENYIYNMALKQKELCN